MATAADPRSDAPEQRVVDHAPVMGLSSYEEALRLWRRAEDVNAWIGSKFEYDMARAMRLSETQRQKNGRMPMLTPEEFFGAPRGVCVDLSRFALETLKSIAPDTHPMYLMIEFDPATIGGNVLRRHWIVSFEHDGKRYFFADSKRPGHIAGPYGSTSEFIVEYARYRGRQIVTFSERASYERTQRARRVRQERTAQPDPQAQVATPGPARR